MTTARPSDQIDIDVLDQSDAPPRLDRIVTAQVHHEADVDDDDNLVSL